MTSGLLFAPSFVPSSNVVYSLRDVEFRGLRKRIICHDLSTGNSPLISVVNYFILEKHFMLNLANGIDTISQSELVQELIRILEKAKGNKRPEHFEKFFYNFKDMGLSPEDIFPVKFSGALLGKCFIDPFNTRWTDDFAASTHSTGFQYMNFPLHHGWLVDPEDHETILAIGDLSSRHLREHYDTLVNWFIKNSTAELTPYGITCLDAELTEGQFTALYRDGRIDLICKHCNSLYVLINETDCLKGSPAAMWKSLSLVQEDEVYFTSHFVPLPGDDQPNENGKRWVLVRAREERKSKKLQKLQQPAKTEGTTDTQLVVQEPVIEPPHVPHTYIEASIAESHDLLKPPPQGQENLVNKQDGKANTHHVLQEPVFPPSQPLSIEWEELIFQKFLEEYIYDDREIPGETKVSFFEAQVDFMKRVRCFDLGVRYTDVEKYNRELAAAIRSDKKRLTELLTQVAIKFMIDRGFADESDIKKKTNLIFYDVPEPFCIQTFLEFIAEIRLVHPYLCGNKFINSPTYIGRTMGVGYLEALTYIHKQKKSLGGEYDISHLKVKNGKFIIDKTAVKTLTKENAWLDFETLVTILFQYYQTIEVPKLPPYFEVFRDDIMRLLPDPQTQPKEFQAFEYFLCKCHLVFKAPLVRSTFFREFFVACQVVRPRKENGKRKWGFALLEFKRLTIRWRERAMYAWPFSCVYWHDNTLGKDKFGGRLSYWQVLVYARYFTEHVVDYMKLVSLLIADLMLGQLLGDVLCELIWIMKNTLLDGPFSDVWTHFEESEYDDTARSLAADGPASVAAEVPASLQAEALANVPAELLANMPAESNDDDAASFLSGVSSQSEDGVNDEDDGSDVRPSISAGCSASEDGKERVLSYGDVVLLRSDLTILGGRDFLNDRIIAFYFAHLSSAFGVNDDDAELLLLPPSIPYLLSNHLDPAIVTMVAEQISLASRRLVLLPVNDNPDASLAEGGSHWTLLVLDATTGASCPRFVHHDSLGIINVPASRCLAAALRPLLPDADNGVPLVEGPMPKQVNGHDCGVYVLAVARVICNWWRDRRGQQQEGGADWFDTVRKEVDAASVRAMRAEMLHLIARLIQEKEEEKKNMDREVGKEN